MEYTFLIDTYESERLMTLNVWSMFTDDDWPAAQTRPWRVIATHWSTWCINASAKINGFALCLA